MPNHNCNGAESKVNAQIFSFLGNRLRTARPGQVATESMPFTVAARPVRPLECLSMSSRKKVVGLDVVARLGARQLQNPE